MKTVKRALGSYGGILLSNLCTTHGNSLVAWIFCVLDVTVLSNCSMLWKQSPKIWGRHETALTTILFTIFSYHFKLKISALQGKLNGWS